MLLLLIDREGRKREVQMPWQELQPIVRIAVPVRLTFKPDIDLSKPVERGYVEFELTNELSYPPVYRQV